MSRINNRWFEHKSWLKRHKGLTVGLFVITILLFVAIFGHIYREQVLSVLGIEKTVEAEKPNVQEEMPVSEEEPTIDPKKPMIALTFDDGPSKHTKKLLNTLQENEAKATFFVVGENVERYPKIIKKVEKIGCEIGNHTYSHPNLTKLKPEKIKSQIRRTSNAVKDVLGHATYLVRPTYGAVNKTVVKNVQYPLIQWSVDTTDWQKKNAKAVEKYILKHAKDGDVILLHDIHATTVEAMETVIPKLKKKGFQLVTVSELAEARGVTLKDGKQYFSFQK